ncbi:MAG: hypothetical protein RLZZ09_2656 [Pseudomonadota bacterium]|jgi:hypothetical protein
MAVSPLETRSRITARIEVLYNPDSLQQAG